MAHEGQLGRSFIIRGKKAKSNSDKTEHWVPANKDSCKPGVKVRFINANMHDENPKYYPVAGIVGTVKEVGKDFVMALIRWPKNTTSGDNKWYTPICDLEVLLCE